MAVLEAMACGVPVVASDTDGLREVVEPGRSGLLAPVGDSAVLARTILRLLRDGPLREQLITGGFARVRGFGVERMVARTESLYRSLRARPPAQPMVGSVVTGLVLTGEGRAA